MESQENRRYFVHGDVKRRIYILYISRKGKKRIKNLYKKAKMGKVKRVCIIVGRK